MPPGCQYVKPTGLVQLKVQKQCINRILRTCVTVNPPEYRRPLRPCRHAYPLLGSKGSLSRKSVTYSSGDKDSDTMVYRLELETDPRTQRETVTRTPCDWKEAMIRPDETRWLSIAVGNTHYFWAMGTGVEDGFVPTIFWT